MKKMFCTFLGLVAMVGCTDNFKRDNPYDPKAPTGIQEPASLCGYVVSSREGAPVSGADVNIVELGRTVTTNDMGIFEFESVPAADWTIEVSVPDGLDSYLPSVRRISLEPGMVIECPPSGQEVPEVQTIVLRRRPDAPRIIDLSADDEGVVLTFSTESKLTSKRYQLHFESVFVGSDEGARPTFEASDVDIVFENDNLTIATLRPFQNGTVEALSPTNTYDLSIRVFDEDLASTYSAPVRYAHRLVFDQCAYNDDQSINNELCAPLDGTLPQAPDAQPTEIDVLDDEYILVERDDCTIGVWKTEGEYLGCVSFSELGQNGEPDRCELDTFEDNISGSSNKITAWQKIGGVQDELHIHQLNLTPNDLSQGECRHMAELGATRSTYFGAPRMTSMVISESLGEYTLLYRTNSEVILVQSGVELWKGDLADAGLPASLRNGNFQWARTVDQLLVLNSGSLGNPQDLSLFDIGSGTQEDVLSLGRNIVDLDMLTSGLMVILQDNGELLFVELLQAERAFKEVSLVAGERDLVQASDLLWFPSPASSTQNTSGVAAILDQRAGIVQFRGVSARRIVVDSSAQWLIDVKARGLGADTFQTEVLDSKIYEVKSLGRGSEAPGIVMRTSPSNGDAKIGVFEFSP